MGWAWYDIYCYVCDLEGVKVIIEALAKDCVMITTKKDKYKLWDCEGVLTFIRMKKVK